MIWRLEYDGIIRTFAEIGIGEARRTRKNLLTDKLKFCITGSPLLSEPEFLPNSVIKIFKNDTKWFEGIVTQTPLLCSSSGEKYEYEISGPWWYLENLIYQQAWKEPIDPSSETPILQNVYKSHIIIGQNILGECITVGQQIREILQYAISCGANFSIGSIDIPVNIPLDECKDLSCADVIRRLIRWVPDTNIYIDYSQNIPTISFLRRTQMPQKSIDLLSNVSEFSIQPRYDLQVPAVVLKFETTNSINGKTWKESIEQKYPTTATGQELKALVLTINLEGSKANYIIQDIETEAITPNYVSWWQSHVAGLSQINSENITIQDVTRTSTLPNELVKGNVAEWMDKTTETDVVRCKISYFSSDESIINREVAVKFIATEAASGSYRKLTTLTTAEQIPTGLTQEIFNSVNPLQYDGTVTTISEEVDEDFFGKLLNLSNGRPELTTMNAVVQEVTEIIDSGKIIIKFGPAKHLGAADLAELTRSGRLLFESRNYQERTTAEATGNGVVEQGIYSRLDNTSFGPGKYKMIKFSDPENSNRSVRIDTADVAVSSANIIFREEDVCDSGVLKKRYSLASQPYSTE